MLNINMEDVVGVINACKPQLIVLAVVLVLAAAVIIAMAVNKKVKKADRFFIRWQNAQTARETPKTAGPGGGKNRVRIRNRRDRNQKDRLGKDRKEKIRKPYGKIGRKDRGRDVEGAGKNRPQASGKACERTGRRKRRQVNAEAAFRRTK